MLMQAHRIPQPKQVAKVTLALTSLRVLWSFSNKDQHQQRTTKLQPKRFPTLQYSLWTTWSWCELSSKFKCGTPTALKNQQRPKTWRLWPCRTKFTRKMQSLWILAQPKLLKLNLQWPLSNPTQTQANNMITLRSRQAQLNPNLENNTLQVSTRRKNLWSSGLTLMEAVI